MEQKYNAPERGSWYLGITTHPGQLREADVVNNIAQMILNSEEVSKKEAQQRANALYQEQIERIMELVPLGVPLKEISQEIAEEYQRLTLDEWMEWGFPRTEWD